MKRISLLTAIALGTLFVLPHGAIVSAQDDDLQGKLVAIEKQLWEGWKNKDAKPFEENIATDTVAINAQGITSGKAQVIKDITGSDCDVKSFSLSDVKLRRLGKDAAMLTYKAKQDATCGGEKIPAEVVVSSTYVNESGTWRATSYHESPVAPAK